MKVALAITALIALAAILWSIDLRSQVVRWEDNYHEAQERSAGMKSDLELAASVRRQLEEKFDSERAAVTALREEMAGKDLEIGKLSHALEASVQQHQAVVQELATQRVEARLGTAAKAAASDESVGSRYLDWKLRMYEQQYLRGSPGESRVRVFLKRIAHFKERWPEHPDMAWVDRQSSRFDGYVDMGAPPTYDDITWEIRCLTTVSPRDYKESFRLLEGFIEREGATPDAVMLRGELEQERREYHDDRMQQAAWEYERDQKAKSVHWLVKAITMIGDAEMEDQAANFLVKIPEVEYNLRGYQSDRPEEFAELIKNSIVRKFAKEKGIL